MKKTIEEQQARIAKRKAKTAKLEQQLKPVDGFIISLDTKWFMYIESNIIKFGVGSYGDWRADVNKTYENLPYHRLATSSEVTERLTKFVNGLGYKEGVEIKSVVSGDVRQIEGNELTFKEYKDCFYIHLDGYAIWSSVDGWAKIVEQKLKYEVVPLESNIYPSGTYTMNLNVTVNCLEYINGSMLAKEIETLLNQKDND